MKNSVSHTAWILVAVVASPVAMPAWADGNTYEVTVTNLTKGQIFSPPIVYSHRGSFNLFTPGEPAIAELAGVAEDADNGPLVALLTAEPRVRDVAMAGDVVMPGASAEVMVQAGRGSRYISALGMLVTTNDAFFAAERLIWGFSNTTYAIAWDAGSEANTQDCAHIPGPPCGNPGVRVEDGAEGYVYVHAGIQDRGSLDPAMHDWRSPVAKITIRRANH